MRFLTECDNHSDGCVGSLIKIKTSCTPQTPTPQKYEAGPARGTLGLCCPMRVEENWAQSPLSAVDTSLGGFLMLTPSAPFL